MAGETERDLASFKRLVRGDREALADLYDAHARRLFRHGLALTRSRSDAEDLVQAVFLKLAATGAPLLAVRSPAGYLHRILRAAWIDARRHSATQADGQGDLLVDCPAPDADGVNETAVDVSAAVNRLSAVQREIVTLHLVEGFSFREAGRITGVSMFTAASRYRVALGRLREMLGRR